MRYKRMNVASIDSGPGEGNAGISKAYPDNADALIQPYVAGTLGRCCRPEAKIRM